MSDDFKRKLESYTNGNLSDDERKEVEQELDKMEIYQAYVDEMMEGKGSDKESNVNEKKLVKRGKWKARFFNTTITIAVLFVFLIISSILTTVYYTQGNPYRTDVYREVMEVSVETFIPNVTMRNSSINTGAFFTAEYSNNNLVRLVGNDEVDIGNMQASFFFSFPNIELPNGADSFPMLIYPEDEESSQADGFVQLENLPEGTVSELYISFSDYMTTDEVLALFEGENMLPRWFAVDVGYGEGEYIYETPVGFPYDGYFLQMNNELVSREEEKTGLFGSVVSEAWQQEGFEAYGDGEARNGEFIQALSLLEQYPRVTEQFMWTTTDRLKEKISYIGEHGVRIYGVVVTGPSKELLKLADEEWVRSAAIGETRLWNWEELE